MYEQQFPHHLPVGEITSISAGVSPAVFVNSTSAELSLNVMWPNGTTNSYRYNQQASKCDVFVVNPADPAAKPANLIGASVPEEFLVGDMVMRVQEPYNIFLLIKNGNQPDIVSLHDGTVHSCANADLKFADGFILPLSPCSRAP